MATNNAVNNSLTGQTGTGNFAGSTSPTLTTPRIGQINDTNGNGSIKLEAAASAVNYLKVTNNITGGPVILSPDGTDTNTGYQMNTKGTGAFAMQSAATGNQLTFYAGTGYQRITNFNWVDVASNQTVTWPNLTGTVALTGASQDVTFNSVSWSDTTKGIVGTTTNDNAAAGYVGEFISSVVLVGSAVSVTANVNFNVTNISLTAGDWDLWGNVNVSSGASNSTYSFAWINTVSATYPADAYIAGLQQSSGITTNTYRVVPYQRLSLSATTTVYLSGAMDGGGTLLGWGGIYARRVR